MRIHLAKSAGFCFGVKRALSIAFNTAKSYKEVYMLGDIVHNEDVVRTIKEIGIKKIHKLACGKNKTLLIRTHGTCIKIADEAYKLGYRIVDATCPMVKEIHKIVRNQEKKGYKIIVIGDKKHDEVHSICGQLKFKAIVINNIRAVPIKKIKKIKRACIVAQSTQNSEDVVKIVKILELYIPELKFFNTICNPTRIKQEEIKTMPLKNDVMIIIGSGKSANTKRLYNISKSLNKRTYWVNSKTAIRPAWFNSAKSVGVTAGASTPEETIKDIIKYISSLPKN